MKIRLLWMLFILFVFTPYGCAFFVPKHETKTKSDFYAEKAECDKEAWSYYQTFNIGGSDDAEATRNMDYSRRCLQKKGWKYFNQR